MRLNSHSFVVSCLLRLRRSRAAPFVIKLYSDEKILIVFHSKTGGAQQMAQAAAKGAGSEPEVALNLIHATEAGPAELLESDGYIFATPENLAMMSGMMKDFFDR